LAKPVLTKTARATAAPAIPIMPHNSQAGKNAPNRSKEGAPPAEQPVKVMDAKDRRANIAFALGKIICRLGIRLARHFTVDAISGFPEKHYNFP
jgi:hypothetical protein